MDMINFWLFFGFFYFKLFKGINENNSIIVLYMNFLLFLFIIVFGFCNDKFLINMLCKLIYFLVY